MKLNDQPLCTKPDCDTCVHYIYLLYRSTGVEITLPDGPQCPCDFCKWKARNIDFFDDQNRRW